MNKWWEHIRFGDVRSGRVKVRALVAGWKAQHRTAQRHGERLDSFLQNILPLGHGVSLGWVVMFIVSPASAGARDLFFVVTAATRSRRFAAHVAKLSGAIAAPAVHHHLWILDTIDDALTAKHFTFADTIWTVHFFSSPRRCR